MAQPKKLEFTALGGLVVQLGFLLLCVVLAAMSGSRAVNAASLFVGAGVLVWFVVLLHGRQRRLAREEREELERLKQTRLSEEIFEETELDRMRASAGLLIFERYLVPFFTVVLSGLLLYFSYRITRDLLENPAGEIELVRQIGIAMVFAAFGGFMVGKYAAGLAQNPDYRLLRAGAGYMLGNVIVAVMIAISMALNLFEVTWTERVVTYIIPAIMALVGLELLLNLLLDVYRPRVPGQERRPPYDSRLLGLFAEPEGVLKTVATTLDYQFGFKVSETWFYRFMERAILPLLLVQVLSLWLLSMLVVVGQDEVVFIERLGRPYVSPQDREKHLMATVFEPGFYLKLPWPFGIARHVPAYQVQRIAVGKIYEPVPMSGPSKIGRDDVILWVEAHINPQEGYEVNFLVPSTADSAEVAASEAAGERPAEARVPQVNLARLEGLIHYRVARKPDGTIDAKAAFDYYYAQSDIDEHVKRLVYRAVCRIAASQDFLAWIAQQRGASVQRLRTLVTEGFAREGLGLDVVYAGIPVVHPPAEAARSYEDVVTSLENKEALSYAGEMQASTIRSLATADAAKIRYEAEGYAARLQATASAQKDLFLAQLAAYRKAPDVYKSRAYLEAMEAALVGQTIFIVPVAPADVEVIDLKQRLEPSFLKLDTEG